MKGIGIKYQLRIITLIPVLLIALLFAVFYNGQFNNDLNQHMARLGKAYIRQLLPAAQLAMMRNDQRTLQGLINASNVNSEIKALAFYNAKRQLMAYRGGKHSLREPFQPPEFTGDYVESKPLDSLTVNFTAPITIPEFNVYSTKGFKKSPDLKTDDILGWLSIDIDTQSLMVKRYQMYIVTIFITLLGLLVSLSVHFFFSRRIYLPVARLRRSMKQILHNEFETHIAVSTTGEIGEIQRGCAHLQQQYLNNIKDLNQHIETATADLQQSLELLEEKNIQLSLEKKKMEEKSYQQAEFIASMSHEIRTPMNGVIGFTNVLLESRLDSLQLDYVKTIKTSSENLLNIINDILDYSKIDAGKLYLDCIPVDIRACIDEVIALSSSSASRKGVDLVVSTEINVPRMVLGDQLRIKQILSNLLTNAIKFTDQGYVLISTAIDQESPKDYMLSIAVSDTGMGISSEDQSKLFTAFSQADISITRRFGGSGLGLIICKKLAETMQGRITLSSEIQKGSTFTVRIRVDKLAAYEVEKKQNYRFGKIKALCFEENALQLRGLINGLGYWGIECVPVDSLTLLEDSFRQHPDCAVAFINVNEGYEKTLTQILHRQAMPCVLISKWMIPEPELLGGKAFLFKPVSIQKLQDILEALFNPGTIRSHSLQPLDKLRAQLGRLHPKILLAEDNPVNRMLLNSLLGAYAEITMVENGREAVISCQNKSFDLLLLDLQMPELTGIEAAVRVRQESLLNKNTPIIVISASSQDLNQEHLQKSGVDLYLQKPIDELQLLSELLKMLEKNQTRAINWELCLQKVSGNQAVAEEFLTRFIEELRDNRSSFLEFYQNNNLQELENAAHKLNGACCFCGVPKLQTQVVRIENMAREISNIKDLHPALTELIRCMDEVIREFETDFILEKS